MIVKVKYFEFTPLFDWIKKVPMFNWTIKAGVPEIPKGAKHMDGMVVW